MTDSTHYTGPTTAFWQELLPPEATVPEAPWRFGYPARLADGSVLMLPIRALPHATGEAVASLLLNQAAFPVVDRLATLLAEQLAGWEPEVVIGLPTLGLTLASAVARRLGQARYLPMGYSRKFWYDEALSAPVHSITSPGGGKRVYLDPNLLELVQGRRVALVDDAVSTGTTLVAAWDLLEALGVNVTVCGVAMLQGTRWRERMGPQRAKRIVGVFESPILRAAEQGWVLRD